jgi:NH3-dependent NAD+ synthetase
MSAGLIGQGVAWPDSEGHGMSTVAEQALHRHPKRVIVVASGGLDSTVLDQPVTAATTPATGNSYPTAC